ncbi:c-type cytochrome [Roseateles oligotrophus]|uniref:C-type cytochrome n=1 Tax=Roseateles oligotrophus TaxID=1769250 RepID=A0ABT2YLR9_9BURK|nr:c-type cytochrome [Roseateles oligotrophus]MCV2371021.1 c-type cytochrome [Roseateles oligotrophus]
MSSWREFLLASSLLMGLGLSGSAQAQSKTYPGLGRVATAAELSAWDIDVRPDFKGLPPGKGSVAQGMVIWEGKCASCHGVFGESNQVFAPLVGGTTAADIQSGRVARLTDSAFPARTTLMKLANLSTLWDYINRAMPWTAPKSLSADEVYAVTAYLLNLGGIVPDELVLSDRNMHEVQALLPNRHGLHSDHGLWPGAGMGNGGKPDVKATACVKDCAPLPKIASALPDFARNAHGNLAEQNRGVGAQHGVDTSGPGGAPAQAPKRPGSAAKGAGEAAMLLTQKHGCVACHGLENKIVGPGLREIANKYAQRADAVAYLSGKIIAGGAGVWGAIPMPAQTISEADAKTIAEWLATGAEK